MQVGDVITTDKPVAGEVPVNVEGTDKFHGRLGQLGGARAVRITRSEGTAGNESGASA
jgi:flagellar motor switch protein FliM